jgi:hypothetical protein
MPVLRVQVKADLGIETHVEALTVERRGESAGASTKNSSCALSVYTIREQAPEDASR